MIVMVFVAAVTVFSCDSVRVEVMRTTVVPRMVSMMEWLELQS